MINQLISYVLVVSGALILPNVQATKTVKPSPKSISLDTCSVNITADNQQHIQNKTIYSGNVTALVGFASLKSNKMTLIRKADGSCELITE